VLEIPTLGSSHRPCARAIADESAVRRGLGVGGTHLDAGATHPPLVLDPVTVETIDTIEAALADLER
jgi:hypothetical protein